MIDVDAFVLRSIDLTEVQRWIDNARTAWKSIFKSRFFCVHMPHTGSEVH